MLIILIVALSLALALMLLVVYSALIMSGRASREEERWANTGHPVLHTNIQER